MNMLLAFVVALVVAPPALELVYRWSRRRLLDIPNGRSSHVRPTPRGGGLAIVVAVTAAMLALLTGVTHPASTGLLPWLLASSVCVAAVSWADDLYTLSARVRLLVHVWGALLLVVPFALWWSPFNTSATLILAVLGVPWIVGVTNAYNFMDGIDGLAGTQAVITGLGWCGGSLMLGAPVAAAVALAITAGSLVFLRRNWSPASIFMGDVGSATLGHLWGALPFLVASELRTAASPAPIIAVSGLFIVAFLFDSGVTLCTRIARRERLSEAHRDHIYQRLVIGGQTHAAVTLRYAAVAITGVFAALMLLAHGALFVTLAAVPIAAMLVLWRRAPVTSVSL